MSYLARPSRPSMSLQNRREKWGQDATVPISDAFDADPADDDEILVEDLDD